MESVSSSSLDQGYWEQNDYYQLHLKQHTVQLMEKLNVQRSKFVACLRQVDLIDKRMQEILYSDETITKKRIELMNELECTISSRENFEQFCWALDESGQRELAKVLRGGKECNLSRNAITPSASGEVWKIAGLDLRGGCLLKGEMAYIDELFKIKEASVSWNFAAGMGWQNESDFNAAVDVCMVSNDHTPYKLRLYVPCDWLITPAQMAVVDPQPLVQYNGCSVPSYSSTFFTCGSHDNFLLIGYGQPCRRGKMLGDILLQGRIWLQAYEYHLQTGDPMSRWLCHC